MGVWGTTGLSKENGEKKMGYWRCFWELVVEGAKKWGKSTKLWGNFQVLISWARCKLFGSYQSLELFSGHVVSKGNLKNHCWEAPILHDIGLSYRQVWLFFTSYLIISLLYAYISGWKQAFWESWGHPHSWCVQIHFWEETSIWKFLVVTQRTLQAHQDPCQEPPVLHNPIWLSWGHPNFLCILRHF